MVVNSVDCSVSLLLFVCCSSVCVLDYFACGFCVRALCAWFLLWVCRLLVIVCGLLLDVVGLLIVCGDLVGLLGSVLDCLGLDYLWVCLLFPVA